MFVHSSISSTFVYEVSENRLGTKLCWFHGKKRSYRVVYVQVRQNFLPPTVGVSWLYCGDCVRCSVLSVQLSVDQKPLGVYRNECIFVGLKLFRGNMHVKVVVIKF